MKTCYIPALCFFTLTVPLLAVPVYEPFADATANNGTAYNPNANLGFDATLTGGQTNAQLLYWADAGTTVASTTITNMSGSLSFSSVAGYSGTLPATTGNSIRAAGINSRSSRMTINSPTGGQAASVSSGRTNIFASFLLKVVGTNGMGTSATFFAGFNNTVGTQTSQPTTVGSKIFGALSTGSPTFRIGIGKSQANAANIGYESGTHGLNDTLFIVIQYTYGANANDGTNYPSKIWVNPSPSTFGNLNAPAPSASSVINTGDTDSIANINTFVFFQRATTQPAYIADELRVSYSWAGVTAAPDITSQPASRTNNAATTASFIVAAVGDPTLSYQWTKGGVPLTDGATGSGSVVAGSTTTNLSISGVLAPDAGSYAVVITNRFGTNTSSTAVLTVNDPAITTHPASQSLPPGANASFSVVAAGTATLTYLWYSNGVAIADGATGSGSVVSGSTTANLTITGIGFDDAGTYACAVTNGLGNGLISSNAVVSILDPAITSQPSSLTTNYGSTATFTVAAAGTPTLTYQWFKGSTPLTDTGNVSGSGSTQLVLTAVSYLDAGAYSVIVTNGSANTTTSSVANLTVRDPFISTPPSGQIKVIGSSASFTVTASGSSLAYIWRKGTTVLSDGGNISGATTATLTLASVATNDNGSYTVIVSNNLSSQVVTSSPAATLSTVLAPLPRTVNIGEKVTFLTAAFGTAPFSFQWNSNGVPISGATGTSFSKANLQVSDSGTYSVTVNNPAGNATATAALTVSPTRLRLSPTNIVVMRHGEGTQTLGNTGNTIFLDQFTTNGTYVNTLMVPDSGPTPLLEAGNSSQEGYMSLSYDKRFLMVAGYPVPLGYTNVSLPGAGSAFIPRGFATVNGLSTYNLVINSSVAYDTDNPRCAVTDGTNSYWTAGSGHNPRYFGPLGQNIQVGSVANTRVIEIFNGDVYYAAASGTYGVHKLVGLPTSLGTDTLLIPTGNSQSFPADFAFDASGTNCYIAEDGGATSNTNVPGITKYTYNAGTATWGYQYTIPVGNGLGSRQMTVDFNVSPPVIYAVTCTASNTTAATANSIVRVPDNGPGSVPVTLFTAGANQGLRGIRFGPISDAPAIATNPADRTNAPGSTAAFTVTVTGSGPLTYKWSLAGVPLTDGGNISGADTATLAISNVSSNDATNGSYSVVITNDLGSITSAPASLYLADPPVITSAPASRTNFVGTAVNFSVSATGSLPFGYQWRTNGVALADGGNVSGSTTANLAISSVTLDQAGAYTVVVNNAAASATNSPAANLIVIPVPPIGSIVLDSGNVIFSGSGGIEGATFYVVASTNVSDPVSTWQPVSTNVFGPGGSYSVTNTVDPNSPSLFYRLRMQ